MRSRQPQLSREIGLQFYSTRVPEVNVRYIVRNGEKGVQREVDDMKKMIFSDAQFCKGCMAWRCVLSFDNVNNT